MTDNPFAPRPIGKDWRPPADTPRRTDRPTEEPTGQDTTSTVDSTVESAIELGDLFPEAPVEQTAPGNSETATDLAELFSLDTEPTAGTNQTGLDDLFADWQPANAEADTQTGDAAAAAQTMTVDAAGPGAEPHARPRTRRGPRRNPLRAAPPNLLAVTNAAHATDVGGVKDDASQTRAPAAAGSVHTTRSDDGPNHHREPTAVTQEPKPAADAAVGGRRYPVPEVPGAQDVPGAARDARPRDGAANDQRDAKNTAAEDRHTSSAGPNYLALFTRDGRGVDQLWQIVDRTMGVIAADTQLSRMTRDLTLLVDRYDHRRQQEEFRAALRTRMAQSGINLNSSTSPEPVLDLIVDEVTGISVLGEYYRDPDVNEILVDRWDSISVERLGKLEKTAVRFRDAQHAESTARGLALKVSDRAVSRSIPLVTAELPSARVTFAFGAVVKGGLSVTIRKFRKLLKLDDLLVYGTLNEEMVSFLRDAVGARASILVSGGTGTGKTTIVNLLSTFIPDSERVVTIEDAFELQLANSHVVSLQTKEASSLDDTVSVTLADLLRNTLRMRPDRIVVGEIREGEGAMVMLTAANTGHDGTITTIHANGADAALNQRLPDLVRQERAGVDGGAIMRSIAGAFDVAVHVTKSRNGRRYISEIVDVAGFDERTGKIVVENIFTGTETPDGVRFERRAVRADTELGRRLGEGGKTSWTR